MILVYGFAPFRRYRRNITQDLLHKLPERPGLTTIIFPVRFDALQFLQVVEALQPQYILGLGQYPRGQQIRIERRAINGRRERKTDPILPIAEGGPASQAVTWKIRPNSQMQVTYDAGRYVCNFSMYTLNHYAQAQGLKYAFLHIPRQFSHQRGIAILAQILDQTPFHQ